MRHRIKGWIRLGAVLSVVWIAVVITIAAREYYFALGTEHLWFVEFVPGTKAPNSDPGVVFDVPRFRMLPLTMVISIPLVAAWTLIPLVVWAAGWVRAGFVSPPKTKA